MVRKTIMLFVKATIIGILINAGLQQMPELPISIAGETNHPNEIRLIQPSSIQKIELSAN